MSKGNADYSGATRLADSARESQCLDIEPWAAAVARTLCAWSAVLPKVVSPVTIPFWARVGTPSRVSVSGPGLRRDRTEGRWPQQMDRSVDDTHGPLTAAMLPYVAAHRSSAAASGQAARPSRYVRGRAPSIDVGAVLGDLMDFRGSLLVAQSLGRLAVRGTMLDKSRADALRERVDERVATLRQRMDGVFRDAANPRNKLPTAAQAYEIIMETGALGARRGTRGGPVLETSTRLWAPLRELVSSKIDYARAVLRELREDISPDLRSLGGAATAVEQLDTILADATHSGVMNLLARMNPAMQTAFEQDCANAVRALPKQPSVENLKHWFVEGGWYARHVELGRDVVLAVLEFEQGRIAGLMDAACDPVHAQAWASPA